MSALTEKDKEERANLRVLLKCYLQDFQLFKFLENEKKDKKRKLPHFELCREIADVFIDTQKEISEIEDWEEKTLLLLKKHSLILTDDGDVIGEIK